MVVGNDGEHKVSPELEFPVCNSISAQAICPPLVGVNPNHQFEFDKRRQLFSFAKHQRLSIHIVLWMSAPKMKPASVLTTEPGGDIKDQ